jgi:dipeptidyl aminopeptidase/acylaminoacyl peptidase
MNNNASDGDPDWSPDGIKIAFNSNRDGNYEVYVMNANGSEQTRLTNNGAFDYEPSWQSLSKQTATLTLQSSTTNTIVDTSFNLKATLSAPKSGTVTLNWSINGSGFIYRRNETMTNGVFDKAFSASSPGTWAFKVVWAGDDEYKSAESNSVTVTIKSLPALAAAAAASPVTVYSGGSSTIRATLTGGGAAITGATVNFVSSNGGIFSTVADKGNGTYVATFTAPDIVAQTVCTVTVSASKSGYLDGSAQTQVTVQPLVLNIYVKWSDDTPIASVALASTSQPSGQTALSGTTDANGQVSFSNVQKGTYTFKATKSGYDDKTWTVTVQQGQATIETITLVKPSGGGIPGYPIPSVALALLAATIILYRWKHIRARPVKHQL